MPILDLEVANINRINTSTLASFRNEVVDTKQSYIENK
jgi:hypothetical protein